MSHHFARQFDRYHLAAPLCVLLCLGASPTFAQGERGGDAEVVLHYDFEDEIHDEQAGIRTVSDKAGPPHSHASLSGDRYTLEALEGSTALRATPGPGVVVESEELNRTFDHGLRVAAKVRFAELPDDANSIVVNKWGAGDRRSFILYYRAPFLRFTVSPDGTSGNATTVLSPKIDAATTYQVEAVYDPAAGEVSLTVTDEAGKSVTHTEAVGTKGFYVSDEPLRMAAGRFDGWVDEVVIEALPEGGASDAAE